MIVLTVAGFQVPVIPLFEVLGNIGAVPLKQTGAIGSNIGKMFGLTVISIVVVVAHNPAVGVKV